MFTKIKKHYAYYAFITSLYMLTGFWTLIMVGIFYETWSENNIVTFIAVILMWVGFAVAFNILTKDKYALPDNSNTFLEELPAEQKQQLQKSKANFTALSILTYVLGIISIVSSAILLSDQTILFGIAFGYLLIIVATFFILIANAYSLTHNDNSDEEGISKEDQQLINRYTSVIFLGAVIIFLLTGMLWPASFAFNWIVFLIAALIVELLKIKYLKKNKK